MPTDLVRLTWRDTDETEIAEGRRNDGHAILPRGRAEDLVSWVLGEYGGRYELAIETWRPPVAAATPEPSMGKLNAAARAVVGFAASHKSEIVTAVAYLASLPMPTPYHQVFALAAVLLGALTGTKYGR